MWADPGVDEAYRREDGPDSLRAAELVGGLADNGRGSEGPSAGDLGQRDDGLEDPGVHDRGDRGGVGGRSGASGPGHSAAPLGLWG